MPINRPKPLFKVASEFNVSTQSIVDTLADNGMTAANRPNFKITQEMYEILDNIYGEDKARSLEHERSKEEYESRRSHMMNQRNESVTLDNMLEPLDELAPLEPIPSKTLEDELFDGLEPLSEPQPETNESEEIPPVVDEVITDSMDSEIAVEENDELLASNDITPTVVSDEEEVLIDEKEPEDEVIVETELEVEVESDTATERQTEQASEEESNFEEVSESEHEQVESQPSHDQGAESDASTTTEEEASELSEQPVARKPGEPIIRGRADKLKGTKVLGKTAFTNDLTSDSKVRKKRKRRKDRPSENELKAQRTSKQGNEEQKKKQEPQKSNKKPNVNKKAKPKKEKAEVDKIDVDKMMRETLKKMQGNSTVGSKRGKRRRQRKEVREEEMIQQQELEGLESEVIEVTEFITANDLAEELGVGVNDIISACMSIGLMITINQRLDAGTIELVASEFDKEVKFIDAEELVVELEEETDSEEDLKPRAPIITVMGHVDHGKTSLLDYIREARVAEGEAGGITQHVGAYEVIHDERKITFLDTPGHEAFTAMRSRGAQATDIVILVVAADDSVMPQTIEAINHAKAAGVPMVVAINKMDKDGATPDRIKQQLTDHDVIVEDWGGTIQYALVSAKTGMGIDDLLEKVLIEAELLELKANPDRRADGVVLEARLDKGKGIVANILVQNGTMNVGDPFVAGPCFGRVRAMENSRGKRVKLAGPATPLQLTGFDDMPQAGDKIVVAVDEKTAKEVANQRQQIRREQALRKTKHMTLDDLSRRLALGEVSELNIIIKADVDGSIEALSGSLQKISTDEVAVNIIHTGAGAISESDVLLASASDAIIIGFQVRPTAQARKLAESEEIDIRLFSVIYDAIDEVRDALEGLLSPELKEQMMGIVEVREIFKVSKVGTIAGCYVTEGKIDRNNPIRIIREGVVIYDGAIGALKRFKDDVKEVASGYECGISIQGYNDIKIGDAFESYKITEEKRTLEDLN
jgi:translation initiation factor IF-2